ncbi:hypothetical protein KFE25_002893 [Diacronema lutheri]|uniref:Ribosomal protein eL8/eL30/eS12/Gadd45 domain-containing protein n=1 Tax=Diacronema lutheri TaxID=2081491 RepID=A0A8J5XJ06_DIALT|nr:hypothetical protein KFE25_002893 [Diacronema lutheri]
MSTSAVKAALDDPLRATWLPLSAEDARGVLDRLHADLSGRAELCTRLRRAHAAAMRLRGGREPDAPTDGIVAGINTVCAHMERGSLRLAIFAKDAWPSACLQHVPLLAHASGTHICLLADAATALGRAIGTARLDALGFCVTGAANAVCNHDEPWQDALVRSVRGKAPAVAEPPWFALVPGTGQ